MVLLHQKPTHAHSICMPSYNNLHILSGSSGVLRPIHGFLINGSSSRCRFRERTEYRIFQHWLSENCAGKGYFSNMVTLRAKQIFFPRKQNWFFFFSVLTSGNSLNISQPRNISQPNAVKIIPGLDCVHLAEFPFHTFVGPSVLAHFSLLFPIFV